MPKLICLTMCFLAWVTAAPAQGLEGCETATLADPPRQVYTCANGLVIEAEALTALQAGVQAAGRAPQTVQVNGNAVLIDLPTGQGPFQIRTPHAIASVRGTIFLVDVQPDQTAVFVVEGKVLVSRSPEDDPVALGPGEGVTVAANNRLEVKMWPQTKVDALLDRFAR